MVKNSAEGALNAPVAPCPVFLRRTHPESLNLPGFAPPPWLPLAALVVPLRDPFPVGKVYWRPKSAVCTEEWLPGRREQRPHVRLVQIRFHDLSHRQFHPFRARLAAQLQRQR